MHALVERTALPERTLQQLDVAQSRSGAVGVQSLHSDLVALAVIFYVYIEAPHTVAPVKGAPDVRFGSQPVSILFFRESDLLVVGMEIRRVHFTIGMAEVAEDREWFLIMSFSSV